jgi:hypothetical protein
MLAKNSAEDARLKAIVAAVQGTTRHPLGFTPTVRATARPWTRKKAAW